MQKMSRQQMENSEFRNTRIVEEQSANEEIAKFPDQCPSNQICVVFSTEAQVASDEHTERTAFEAFDQLASSCTPSQNKPDERHLQQAMLSTIVDSADTQSREDNGNACPVKNSSERTQTPQICQATLELHNSQTRNESQLESDHHTYRTSKHQGCGERSQEHPLPPNKTEITAQTTPNKALFHALTQNSTHNRTGSCWTKKPTKCGASNRDVHLASGFKGEAYSRHKALVLDRELESRQV